MVESKEVEPSGTPGEIHDRRLLGMQPQPEGDKDRRYFGAGLLGPLFGGTEDHEVVRIADDLRLRPVGRPVRPVKGLLKPVQVDVGQQRRKRSSNNVAKNGLTMHIDIPRSRLKAGYGQGTRFQQDISEKEVT